MMKKYYFRICFWEAWLEVKTAKFFNQPDFLRSFWEARLNHIKNVEI